MFLRLRKPNQVSLQLKLLSVHGSRGCALGPAPVPIIAKMRNEYFGHNNCIMIDRVMSSIVITGDLKIIVSKS